MSKKLLSILFTSILTISLSGCQKTEKHEAPAETPKIEEEIEETAQRKPGETPFEYPTVSTTAKAEDWVLAPSTDMLEEAFETGIENTIFIFYAAQMVEPGEKESKLKNLLDQEIIIPNSLIIPLKPAQTVEKGDILLTWWQSGSGLQRAIVQTGGTEPVVRYLDEFIEREDTLQPGSFHKLENGFNPGVSVAIKNGEKYNHGILVNLSGEKAIVSGFNGVLEIHNKSDLKAIPTQLELVKGDTFLGPVIGQYDQITVKSLDTATGQIVGEHEFAGTTTEDIFFYGEITKNL